MDEDGDDKLKSDDVVSRKLKAYDFLELLLDDAKQSTRGTINYLESALKDYNSSTTNGSASNGSQMSSSIHSSSNGVGGLSDLKDACFRAITRLNNLYVILESSNDVYNPSGNSSKKLKKSFSDDEKSNRKRLRESISDELKGKTSRQKARISANPNNLARTLPMGPSEGETKFDFFKRMVIHYKMLHGTSKIPDYFVVPWTNEWPADMWDVRLGQRVYDLRRRGSFKAKTQDLADLGIELHPTKKKNKVVVEAEQEVNDGDVTI